MKLLAWDTSSKEGALVALSWGENLKSGWNDVKLVAEWSLNVELTHSERLLWGIDQIIQASRWKLEEIDLFGVGVGPGSFTGLRVGITTARTLASTLGKPLIGVSSLAALARPHALWLSQENEKATLIASIDACKGELFALWGQSKSLLDCIVKSDGDFPGFWKRGVEEQVIEPENLISEIQKRKAPWLAIGEGRNRYLDVWKKLPASKEIKNPIPFSNQVQGRFLGQLAWEGFQAGLARKALDVHPRYLRVADAEKKLKAGLLKQQAK